MRDRIRREGQEKLQKVRKFKKCELTVNGGFISEKLLKKINNESAKSENKEESSESNGGK